MSFFNFFGTPKKQVEAEKTSKIVDAIHSIADTLKTQEKRKAHLEKQIEALTADAREFVRIGKKESASTCLKKRKMYENQVKTIDDAMFNLEVQKLNLENTQFQKSAVESFAKVNSVLKETGIKADDVEKLVVRLSTSGAATTNNRSMPDICLQQMCAVMLLDGIVTFESAHDEKRMRDRKVLALRSRIELIGEEALQRLLPERHGIAEFTLKDGRLVSGMVREETEAVVTLQSVGTEERVRPL